VFLRTSESVLYDAGMVQLSTRDRLIVALDFPSLDEARRMVAKLGDTVSFYKVGLEVFTAAGPALVQELVGQGKKVFLDLKLHEIPNSVAGGAKSAAMLGASMVTVHASGGPEVLRAAAEVERANPGLTVLAVTVLTSLSAADLQRIGIHSSPKEQVLRLAKLAKEQGCGGVVASPEEAAMLRKELGPQMAIVTPGIRPAGSEVGDQQRIATPGAAIRAGASHLVVGRPITRAADPKNAAEAILKEIESASK
jgi:orotidine-5'-phosphate decarboxylase